MFYSQIILAKKGPLGKIWLAAHWDKKLTKVQIFQTDIQDSVESIVHPQVPLALRVSGHLLLGVVRIYSRKVKYLFSDCSEALVKIKMAFRPGVVNLPTGASEVSASSINVSNFGEFDVGVSYSLDSLPAAEPWMTAQSQTMARRQDITLDEAQSMNKSISSSRDLQEDSFGDAGADNWFAFDPNDGFAEESVDDIEIRRGPDDSMHSMAAETPMKLAGLQDDDSVLRAKDTPKDEDVFGDGTAFDDGWDVPMPDEAEVDPRRMSEPSFNIAVDPASPDVSRRDSMNFGTPEVQVARSRKRKLLVDESTQLQSDFIKKCLADQSKITRKRVPVMRKRPAGLLDGGATSEDSILMPSEYYGERVLKVFKKTMEAEKLPFSRSEKPGLNESNIDVEEAREENIMEDQPFGLDDGFSLVEEESAVHGHIKGDESGLVDPAEPDASIDDTNDVFFDDQPSFAENEDPDELNLAPMNDFQAGQYDEETGVSVDHEGSNWHPHTVQVMRLLRRTLGKKEHITYKEITRSKQDRRTAAACFFEVLQLKTWDYIDVDQSEPYADIKITKTKSFFDSIPAIDSTAA